MKSVQRSATFDSAMGHAHTPPELPEITDEAGDTPRWVPVLGLVLFVLSAGAIVWCHTACDADQGSAQAE